MSKKLWPNLYIFLFVFALEGLITGGILALISHTAQLREYQLGCIDPFLASTDFRNLIIWGCMVLATAMHVIWLRRRQYQTWEIIVLCAVGIVMMFLISMQVSANIIEPIWDTLATTCPTF